MAEEEEEDPEEAEVEAQEDVPEVVEEDENDDHQQQPQEEDGEEVKIEQETEVHLFTDEEGDENYVPEQVHETEVVAESPEPINDSARRKHPNTCPGCQKVYSTQTHFKMHWDSKCGQDKKFECEHCGAKFISHASRKVHILKHVGGQEFKCEHCEKAFLSAGQLKVHMRLVSNYY